MIQLQVTPETTKTAAMLLADIRIKAMLEEAGMMTRLHCPTLASALRSAADGLTKALQDYAEEQSRAVQVATPADVPRLVQP
jgi:hypothetical protein